MALVETGAAGGLLLLRVIEVSSTFLVSIFTVWESLHSSLQNLLMLAIFTILGVELIRTKAALRKSLRAQAEANDDDAMSDDENEGEANVGAGANVNVNGAMNVTGETRCWVAPTGKHVHLNQNCRSLKLRGARRPTKEYVICKHCVA